MPAWGWLMMGLGIFFTLLVGGGLMALMFYSSRAGFDEPPQVAQEKKHRAARWTKMIPKRNKRRSSSLFSHGGCVECPLWIKSGHLVLLEKESALTLKADILRGARAALVQLGSF